MPELAEVKLMTEFFNSSAGTKRFRAIHKSTESKVKTDLSLTPTDVEGFTVDAYARGKESVIVLTGMKSGEERNLMVTYGMSGHWRSVNHASKIPNHSHLMFEAFDGSIICLVDVRRFAKWKWVEGWSSNRGPDPAFEFDLFVQNLKDSSHKKVFDKPICEMLMDQKYFNGIGNYLRAEILYRAKLDPWTPARDSISDGKLLALCRIVPLEAYKIGGGSIRDWKNPYGDQKITMDEWMQCYGKKKNIIDGTGRTFWFDASFVSEANLQRIKEMVS
jgi:endonuclease VIII-like 1